MPDAGGKGPRTTSVEARPRHLAGHDSGDGNSGIRSTGAEMEKNPAALDAEGAQLVIIATLRAWIGSKAQPKWEISVNGKATMEPRDRGGTCQISMNRRLFLKGVAGTAAASTATTAWASRLADRRNSPIAELYQSLSVRQRGDVCFDWDHRVNIKYGRKPLTIPDPKGVLLRTHVSNAWLITPHMLADDFYTEEQRGLVVDVLDSVLSPGWTQKIMRQATDDSGKPWGELQSLAFFGSPESGRCLCVVTGFHLTLRATYGLVSAAAFDGPISHGHQPSGFYEKVGHPGNLFWHQALLANLVYQGLDRKHRQQALVRTGMPYYQSGGEIDRSNVLPDDPWDLSREADIRFRGPKRQLPGMPVSGMATEQQRAVAQLLEGLVEPYQQRYRDQVYDCLQKQGGLEKCSLAFYNEHDMGLDEEWDNWRLEGPSFVWYFRGSPHVHIWIHVANGSSAPMTSYFG